MSSSVPIPDKLNLNSVVFPDNTQFVSASQLIHDTRVRKKFRVDKTSTFYDDVTVYGNITVTGNVSSGIPGQTSKDYVDNQTGWGRTEWTFAGATYNSATDSLIMKIYDIYQSYASLAYVDTKVQNVTSKYLQAYDAGTFSTYSNPGTNYPYPVTTLTANSGFIIRDSNNSFSEFKFQKGNVSVGYVLKCLDGDGSVGWQPENSSTNMATTIATDLGATNTSFSLKVSDATSGRGFLFFPNMLSNVYNKALTDNSVCLMFGTGDLESIQKKYYLACYSTGTEAIEMTNTTNASSPDGSLILYGGSAIKDQQVSLSIQGIQFKPKYNSPVSCVLPYVPPNSATDFYTKPFFVHGPKHVNDAYPLLLLTKEDSSTSEPHASTSIMLNPRSGSGSWHPLSQNGNPQIIFANSNMFNASGPTTGFNSLTASTLLIGPWSSKCEGIQIRNTLQSEINPPSSTSGGMTRITGGGEVYAGSVAAHYFEVNKQGIFLKNSSTTQTKNYGKFQILNKNGSIFNNIYTDQIAGSFECGQPSDHCSASFWGNVSLKHVSDLYIEKGASLNSVLVCVDASTGRAAWQPPAQPTIPQEIIVNSISTNYETITDLSSVRELKTAIVTSMISNAGVTLDIYDEHGEGTPPGNSTPIEIPRNTSLTLKSFDYTEVATVEIPANDYSLYQIEIPLVIQHEWNFLNNRQENDERVNFYYEIKEIKYKIEYTNFATAFEGTTGPTSEEIVAVGFDRHIPNQSAPTTKYNIITQQVFLKTVRLFLNFPISTQPQTFHISILPIIHFLYSGEIITNYRLYQNNNYVSHVWIPFKLLTNSSSAPPTSSNNINNKYGLQNLSLIEEGINKTAEYLKNWDAIKWDSIVNYKTGGAGEPGYYGNSYFYYVPRNFGRIDYALNPKLKLITANSKSTSISNLSVNKLLVQEDLQIINGYITTQGIRCRRGMGNVPSSDLNNRDGASSGSYAWRLIRPYVYNIDLEIRKNNTNLLQIWVDNDKAFETTTNVSDYRLKENLQPPPCLLDRFTHSLPIYSFDFKKHGLQNESKNHIGVLAHELQEIFPDVPHLVNGEKDGDTHQTINHQETIMLLMATVKELALEVENLKIQLSILKSSFSS